MNKSSKGVEAMRDTRKIQEYYDGLIAECEKEIERITTQLSQNPACDKRRFYHSLGRSKLDKVMCKYARGDDIGEVKKELEQVMLEWQDYRLEVKYNANYMNNATEFCIRVLLDMDTSYLLNIIKEEEEKGEYADYKDWFLHFVGSKGENLNEKRKCIYFAKEYNFIKEFVMTKDNRYLHQYMERWAKLRPYNKLNPWNIQAAAVVKIMKLNKEEFKNYEFFPYDLL